MAWKQRFQPCLFCGEPLPGNWFKVIKKERTGWILHLHCDRAIARLKAKDLSRISYDKVRRNLMYINLNNKDTVENVLVYQ